MLRSGQLELDLMSKTVAAFEARFPQITVDKVLATPESPYDVKTDALIAAGTPPALWFPAATRGYRYHATLKQIEPLDDLIARDKFDLSAFVAAPLAFCKWDGKYSGLPIQTIPQVLVWNETLFQSNGAAPPPTNWQDRAWTWEPFMTAAQRLTRRTGDPAGSQFGAVMNTGRFAEQTHGGDFFDDPAYESGFPDPAKFPANRAAVAQAWEFLHGLIFRSQVQPTTDESNALRGALPNVFLSGKIGMLATTSSFLATAAQIQNFKWRVATFPAAAALPRRNWFYADQWVMMRTQPNRDAAWELLKHMSSVEAHRTYVLPLGWLSPHKALADEWIKFQKEKTGLSDADLRVIIDGVGVSRITPSHALVNYARIWGEGIDPERAKLFRNETTVNSALDALTPVTVNLIRETNPKK
jgi:multiple sugar transport system substrate-binding protein